MNACKTITTALPPAVVAMIVPPVNVAPPAGPQPPAAAPPATPSATRVIQDDSANYREEILRRYESPFEICWVHGGINE